MSADKLKPADVEGFMMAISPDAVPPEFVADAAPLFLSLRIPPDVAVKRMMSILHDGLNSLGYTEPIGPTNVQRTAAMHHLRRSQGWQRAAHWDEPESRRAHIDATVERWCS